MLIMISMSTYKRYREERKYDFNHIIYFIDMYDLAEYAPTQDIYNISGPYLFI